MANSGLGPYGNPPPGPPPGAPPPEYGGGPPPGDPPGPGPAGPPSPKKTSPAVLVALGCGLLLVLGGIAAALGVYLFTRSAKHGIEQLPEIASSLAPPPSAIPVLPPPIPPDPSLAAPMPAGGGPAVPGRHPAAPGPIPSASPARGTTASPSASASPANSAAAIPSQTCAKAAACCRVVLSRSPGAVSALAGNCESVKALSDSMCEGSLATYRQAARLAGASCD